MFVYSLCCSICIIIQPESVSMILCNSDDTWFYLMKAVVIRRQFQHPLKLYPLRLQNHQCLLASSPLLHALLLIGQ